MRIMQFDGLIPTEFDHDTEAVIEVSPAQVYINIDAISSFHEIMIPPSRVCTLITMTNLNEILVEYSAQDFFTELQLAQQELIA